MKKSIVIFVLLINNSYCQDQILNSREIEHAIDENKLESKFRTIKSEDHIPYYERMNNISSFQPSSDISKSTVNFSIPLIWYTESF